MLEKKRQPKTNLREAFKTYDIALSPLTTALGLGFAACWICNFLSIPKTLPVVFCVFIGFVLGLSRLLNHHKQKPDSIKHFKDEQK